jgi:hypothetical protein
MKRQPKRANPVARYLYEGETGWKAQRQVHSPKRAYRRDRKAGMKELNP